MSAAKPSPAVQAETTTFTRRSMPRATRLGRSIIVALCLALPALVAACSGHTSLPDLSPIATPSPTTTATPTASPRPSHEAPLGFPLDPGTRLGRAVGAPGSRQIVWEGGPTAESYTRDDQPSDDPERANRSGWNCRVHVEDQDQPAADWYIRPGTPVIATMDGTATLNVITTTNAFQHYGVDREPWLGRPDRTRAPRLPFPGPTGDEGVFVRIENSGFVVEYAHLDLTATAKVVPAKAFLSPFAADLDHQPIFSAMRPSANATTIARWNVRDGDVIGLSGDSGYSEAPHLHYTIRRAGNPARLCPTTEAGFSDGGWLLR